MLNLKTYIKIALTYFLLAALLGIVLRFFPVTDMPIRYKFFVHTHSHIALLGWVYLALTTLLYKLYLGKLNLDKKYQNIFWFTQVTLIGMLLTFPFMGYALFSIIFSTLFLFASYWFAWFFYKNVPKGLKTNHSYKCVVAALWYLVVSSLGPWALGAIMNTLGAESIWYRLAIYFYLHFLYNGWMIMALVGILLFTLESHQIILSSKNFTRFFWCVNLGIMLSSFLSTLFANPPLLLNILGGLGGVLQLAAFGILLRAFTKRKKKKSPMFSSFQNRLLLTVAVLLTVKMLLQLLTAFPYFASLAATYLDFTIGYLHWTFLGLVTLGLFLFLDYFGMLKLCKRSYYLYLIGFLITEGLIFYKAITAWQSLPLFNGYFETLVVGSMVIPIVLFIILWNNLKPTAKNF